MAFVYFHELVYSAENTSGQGHPKFTNLKACSDRLRILHGRNLVGPLIV